ncbi:hypothetical protein [Nostoc phage N1]|nr:hypothetical protein [Nostoc phage N1]
MSSFLKNKKVLEGLNTLSKPGSYQHCFLIEYIDNTNNRATATENKNKLAQGFPVYQFLYNPETISLTLPISYQEIAIPFTGINQVNYSNGGNITMNLNNLILDTMNENKSLQPLIDKLISLREPTVKTGLKSHPKILYFKWGSNTFGTCVLTNVSFDITRWNDGFPVKARMSMSLKEVPKPVGDSKAIQEAKKKVKEETVQNGNLKKGLTEKQILDGQKVIREYFKKNLSFQPKRVQDVLNNPKSIIKIDKDTGQVSLYDASGEFVQLLGNYNGDTFTPTRQ